MIDGVCAPGRGLGDWLRLHARDKAGRRLHRTQPMRVGRQSQGEEPGGRLLTSPQLLNGPYSVL